MKQALYICSAIIILYACGPSGSGPSDEVFSGITKTLETGQLIDKPDANDWLPQGCDDIGAFGSHIEDLEVPDYCTLDGLGAYPNPCNDNISICFYILKPGFMRISLYDKPGSEKEVLLKDSVELSAGSYVYSFDVASRGLQPGIYRIYYAYTVSKDEVYKSFGDIQVK